MKIHQHTNGVFAENTWLYLNEDTKEAIIVDPGENLNTVYSKLEGYQVTHIFITHGHHDHIFGLSEIKTKYPNAIIVAHEISKNILPDSYKNLASSRGRNVIAPPPDWTYSGENSTIYAAGQEWALVHTPGHAIDHTIFIGENGIIFGGDLLFAQGGVGRTDIMGGNLNDLRNSVMKALLLPDSSIIYPGHGNTFTIAEAKLFFS